MSCHFKIVKPNIDKEKEVINLDVVHNPPKLEDLLPRPPVVTIVGHIDHGKTTLLDRLRRSNVVDTEFGGITQHIGAFSVTLEKLNKVTFLDTPGHAAFKNMRVRGALVTDVVILVVDACEGPLEQTLESLEAVKKARVSLIVAINKIDKPGADIEKTKKALHKAGVALEDFGGDIQAVAISALNGTGVDDLIEAVLTQAEILQLSADPVGPVEATVIESFQEKGLGKTATILVKRGTLKVGKYLVCGETYARVKQVLDTRTPIGDATESRTVLNTVGPSEACRVVGWKDIPNAGQVILEVESEKRAQEVVNWRLEERKKIEQEEIAKAIGEKRLSDRKIYQEYRGKKLEAGQLHKAIFAADSSEAHQLMKEKYAVLDDEHKVSVIIKADVDGSLDAIRSCLETYDDDRVTLDIITAGVGEVSEADLRLAQDFNGVVYAFNTSVSDDIRKAASSIYGVSIRDHQVIYSLVDDIRDEINQKMPEEDLENILGKGLVAQEFTFSENKNMIPIAGCRVSQGSFYKDKLFRIQRGKEEIHIGPLHSLRYIKDEVNHIRQGQECGVRLKDSSIRFKTGDAITCFELRPEKQKTTWFPGF